MAGPRKIKPHLLQPGAVTLQGRVEQTGQRDAAFQFVVVAACHTKQVEEPVPDDSGGHVGPQRGCSPLSAGPSSVVESDGRRGVGEEWSKQADGVAPVELAADIDVLVREKGPVFRGLKVEHRFVQMQVEMASNRAGHHDEIPQFTDARKIIKIFSHMKPWHRKMILHVQRMNRTSD